MNRLCLFLLLFVASCNPCCFAQIELTKTDVQVVTGLVHPQVIGNAVVIGGDSKPVIATAAMIEVTSKQKASTIEALQIPTLEPGEINPAGENRWLLVGSGSYLVTAYASQPTFQIRHLKVDLSGEPPKPPEPPEPPAPKPDELSQVSKDSRAAMQVFVQSMAGNFNQLAAESRLSKFKTVLDASNAANALDVISRNQFKAAMAKVMQPKLGNADLPADAAQTFEQIAIGFKEVK